MSQAEGLLAAAIHPDHSILAPEEGSKSASSPAAACCHIAAEADRAAPSADPSITHITDTTATATYLRPTSIVTVGAEGEGSAIAPLITPSTARTASHTSWHGWGGQSQPQSDKDMKRQNRHKEQHGQGSSLACLPCRLLRGVLHSLHIVLKLIVIVLRLSLYALLLMPGFIQMIFFYCFSGRVVRGIAYGSKPRQRLDLYLPKDRASTPGPWPVVIYVTGGAWVIGYRAWGALLGRRLSGQGVLVACLDYRNFPGADALDMLEDVNCGIEWVLLRIRSHGGDPDCVTLVGQSAGGHLAGLALVRQAQQAATGRPGPGARPAWHPASLRAFVGVSAALDLRGLTAHRGGMYKALLDRIMALEEREQREGERDVEEGGAGASHSHGQGQGHAAGAGGAPATAAEQAVEGGARAAASAAAAGCSEGAALLGSAGGEAGIPAAGASADPRGRPARQPARRRGPARPARRPAYSLLSPLEAARSLPPGAASVLPPMLLIHGTHDKTVPAAGSMLMAQALQDAGASCRLLLVSGKTHTSFLLEDPMRGGTDMLTDTVLEAALPYGGLDSSTADGACAHMGTHVGGADGHARVHAAAGTAPAGVHVRLAVPDAGGAAGPAAAGGAVEADVVGAAAGRNPARAGGALPAVRRHYGTMCPGWLCDLAGWVCPF